jgi:hypothetical protein
MVGKMGATSASSKPLCVSIFVAGNSVQRQYFIRTQGNVEGDHDQDPSAGRKDPVHLVASGEGIVDALEHVDAHRQIDAFVSEWQVR